MTDEACGTAELPQRTVRGASPAHRPRSFPSAPSAELPQRTVRLRDINGLRSSSRGPGGFCLLRASSRGLSPRGAIQGWLDARLQLLHQGEYGITVECQTVDLCDDGGSRGHAFVRNRWPHRGGYLRRQLLQYVRVQRTKGLRSDGASGISAGSSGRRRTLCLGSVCMDSQTQCS